MATLEDRAPRTYGNWQRPTSPGLLGLGSLGTLMLFGGLIFTVLTVMLVGFLAGVGVFLVVAIAVAAVTTRDRHGMNILTRTTARLGWWSSRARGLHLYRSGPLGRALWGTYQLPGLVAGVRLSEHQDAYGRPFAMLYCPATWTYSVVIGTEPVGGELVEQGQVDVWVSRWGRWLAKLADESGLEGASVTVETAPDSGARLRQEVEGHLDPDAPAFAQSVMRQVVDDYSVGSSQVRAYIALTFSAASRVDGKRRNPDDMGRDLAARLPGLTAELAATGAGGPRLVNAQELCELVRVAYDPAAAPLIDEAHAAGEIPDLRWSDVGPAAAQATWDGYRHDSAFSMTWGMTEAPRGNSQSDVLERLLAPHDDIARKRVTLLYRPLPTARASAIVETNLRAAEFKVTSSSKPTARALVAARQAQAIAAEEANGAGLVQFGLLVTATVEDLSKERLARAAIDTLGATARVQLRPMYGTQDAAFAAALPLGLVLPKHVKIPTELREKL